MQPRRSQRTKQNSSLMQMMMTEEQVPTDSERTMDSERSAQGLCHGTSTAGTLRRMKRRLLMLSVQVEPSRQTMVVGPVNTQKPDSSPKPRKSRSGSDGCGHSRNKSCVF